MPDEHQDAPLVMPKIRKDVMYFVAFLVTVSILLLIAEQKSPEQIANGAYEERVNAEAEKTFRAYKRIEETARQRPLNAVEERNIREMAQNDAKATVRK